MTIPPVSVDIAIAQAVDRARDGDSEAVEEMRSIYRTVPAYEYRAAAPVTFTSCGECVIFQRGSACPMQRQGE